MGREIRRVPENWQHPKMDSSDYQPMFDKNYDDAMLDWITQAVFWEAGQHLTQLSGKYDPLPKHYWEWDSLPGDEECYRTGDQVFSPEEATHYQMYETVTEGTPVSPVFASLDELEVWLVQDYGYSEAGAKAFCKMGYIPSGIGIPGQGFLTGSEAAEFLGREKEKLDA